MRGRDLMYCIRCGKQIDETANYCPFCSNKVNKGDNKSNPIESINKLLGENDSFKMLRSWVILILTVLCFLIMFILPFFQLDNRGLYDFKFGAEFKYFYYMDDINTDINTIKNISMIFLIIFLLSTPIFTFLKYYKLSCISSSMTFLSPIIMQILLNIFWVHHNSSWEREAKVNLTFGFYMFMVISLIIVVLTIINNRSKTS